jgi:hypothetical protein
MSRGVTFHQELLNVFREQHRNKKETPGRCLNARKCKIFRTMKWDVLTRQGGMCLTTMGLCMLNIIY